MCLDYGERKLSHRIYNNSRHQVWQRLVGYRHQSFWITCTHWTGARHCSRSWVGSRALGRFHFYDTAAMSVASVCLFSFCLSLFQCGVSVMWSERRQCVACPFLLRRQLILSHISSTLCWLDSPSPPVNVSWARESQRWAYNLGSFSKSLACILRRIDHRSGSCSLSLW